jgi:hypothetical protein
MKMAPGPWVKVTFSLASAAAMIVLPRPSSSSAAVVSVPAPDSLDRPPHLMPHAINTVTQATRLYTVISGDSISGVAAKECHGQDKDWTGIYAESRAEHLTGKNANEINIGQQLAISCAYVPSQLKYADPPKTVSYTFTTRASGGGGGGGDPYDGHHGDCGDGDGDGMDAPCSVIFPNHGSGGTVQVTRRSTGGMGNVNPASYSGFQQCVITRESGGNSQVMNSSGHYGLYQFSASTWQAYGGSAASFGHASASEQTRIFNNAMARGGQNNWSPYDGC